MEEEPTPTLRTTVGKSSAAYTYKIANTPAEALFPQRRKTVSNASISIVEEKRNCIGNIHGCLNRLKNGRNLRRNYLKNMKISILPQAGYMLTELYSAFDANATVAQIVKN